MIALALLLTAVTEAPPDVVRVKARPDLPWVTAVFASKSATVDEKRIKADAPANALEPDNRRNKVTP